MTHDNPPQVLSEAECWARLEVEEFGRMAYHLADEVHIVPVNYAVDEYAADRRRIVFRTAEGSKLFGVVMNADVAFEIDRIEEERELAWSVVARGKAHILQGEEAREADHIRLRPWVDDRKFNVVAIEVEELTGRQFTLSRPWRSMLPPEA